VAERYLKPCFDSSVFLGGLNGEICNGIKRAVVFNWLWAKAKGGKYEKVYISALTLAEVFKTKKRTGEPAVETATDSLDEFLTLIEEDFVEVIEIDRLIGLQSHALCRKYKIWPNDGIQLACALRAQCDALVIWDRPVLLAVKHDDIRIEEPLIYERDLFTFEGVELATSEEITEYEKKHPKAVAAAVASPANISRGGNGSPASEATTATPDTVAVPLRLDDTEEEEPEPELEPQDNKIG
jgi:predicted nucleic acid-binding protein